jgi:hypothetical protein
VQLAVNTPGRAGEGCSLRPGVGGNMEVLCRRNGEGFMKKGAVLKHASGGKVRMRSTLRKLELHLVKIKQWRVAEEVWK